jgi:hypothetical protein
MKIKWVVLFVLLVFAVNVDAQRESLSPSAGSDVSVVVDNNPPIVILDNPKKIMYNNATPIPVDYTIQDVSHDSTWYWLNDGINVSVGGNFTLDLAEGNYTLRIYANDSFNRMNFAEVNFSVNNSIVYCGNNACDGIESCSSCTVDCGACMEEPPSSSSSSSGGSSGGDSSGSRINKVKFELDKTQIRVSLKQGGTKRETLEIRNNENKKLKFDVSSSFSSDLVRFSETEFELSRGESRKINVDFIALQNKNPDLYLGEIVVRSGDSEERVISAIEVESANALFDIKLEVPAEYLTVLPGNKILASITIFSLGREGRVDTNVKYQIKNENGKIIFESEEVVAVDVQTSFVREFQIPSGALPGRYVLYVPVRYNGSSGSASQWFEVVSVDEKAERKELKLVWLILLLMVILVVLVIERTVQQKKHSAKKKNKKKVK